MLSFVGFFFQFFRFQHSVPNRNKTVLENCGWYPCYSQTLVLLLPAPLNDDDDDDEENGESGVDNSLMFISHSSGMCFVTTAVVKMDKLTSAAFRSAPVYHCIEPSGTIQ